MDADLPCFQCGYNLRSLRMDAHCPECGFAVEQSTGLNVAKRWPFNAVEPCRGLAFGLITMLAIGLGIVPWVIGLAFLLWRMPAGLFWTPVKYATWLSFLGVAVSIVSVLSSYSAVYRTVGIDTVLGVFVVALLAHYACIFAIAIGITSRAGMRGAMGVAIVCCALQAVMVFVALVRPNTVDAFAGLLILSGLCWMVVGTFYWSYIANTLEAQRLALIRTSKDQCTQSIPSHKV
ncbi:hypothetical protein OT109_16815 [Phycisphaeraceae bacterium D3-23]